MDKSQGELIALNEASDKAVSATSLAERLSVLGPQAQQILEVVSLGWTALHRGQLIDCLQAIYGEDQVDFEAVERGVEWLLSAGYLQLQGQRLISSPGIAEPVARSLAQKPQAIRKIDAIRRVFRVSDHRYGNSIKTFNEGLRDLRLSLYAGQLADFQRLLQALQGYFSAEWKNRHPYLTLFDTPFDPIWMDTLPGDMAAQAAATILAVRAGRLENADPALEWLMAKASTVPVEQISWYATVISEHLVLQGRFDEAQEWALKQKGGHLPGLVSLLRGQLDSALGSFEGVLQDQKKSAGAKKTGPGGLSGVALVIALIASGESSRLEQAAQQIAASMRVPGPWLSVFAALGHAARAGMSVNESGESSLNEPEQSERESMGLLFVAECLGWVSPERLESLSERLQRLYQRALDAGYQWVAAESADLLFRAGLTEFHEAARTLHHQLGSQPLSQAIRRQPTWERGLLALQKFASDIAIPTAKPKSSRLVWHVSFDPASQSATLEPREQKRDVSGHWSKGRPLSLKRVISGAEMDYLTDQDRAALAFIRTQRGRQNAVPSLDMPGALSALVGHPLLFWARQPERSLSLVRGEPELSIRLGEEGYVLHLSPRLTHNATSHVIREAPDRLRLIELRSEHQRLVRILGDHGLTLPVDAETPLKEVLGQIEGRMAVISQLPLGDDIPSPANPKLYALFWPHPAGLSLEFVCYPLGEGDWAFTPGEGPIGLRRRAESGLKPVIRDLDLEKDRALYWLGQCDPWLHHTEDHALGGVSKNVFAACEMLELLRAAQDEVDIRWPAGEAIRIAGEAGLEQCSVKIKAGENWLSVDGEVAINEEDILSFKALLSSSQQNSRFVALADGRYVRLHQALLEKARSLSSLGEWGSEGFQVHPIAAHSLKGALDDVGHLTSSSEWTTLLQRQNQIHQTTVEVPPGLQAELRDYQKQGFVWLVRLAELGAGACLADDMGLGKTVQVLTLLLHRQALGPQLVVAPTSVAGNWVQECQRFAPALRIHWIGPGQRENERISWTAGDLVITSYTLFQQDVLGLSQSRWASAILDEAQAIKNTGTKRSQSAMRLEADFKVITTGTPIENNLSELWNLFRFINPGLLGSLESFQTRFAIPVERDGEEGAREHLKRLIAPFVLRRTKSEVLKELPERTEVTLRLDFGSDEKALYEALRREILKEVEEDLGDNREPNRMRVLAGIMKLRRMCCHPRLILGETELSATKTAAFLELVRELKEGGHRALVFSQFVDHLQILKQALDQRGIRYSYLDGATPLSERVRRVAAFQAGESELFLISLRAGGTGLNLTAADYVIHMDPWWNPAVEDQASDRAHRMGQTRPVTVYRLIMAQTIEEKIVALHERKRHLADSLLDGVGEATTLSVNELLGLLKDA